MSQILPSPTTPNAPIECVSRLETQAGPREDPESQLLQSLPIDWELGSYEQDDPWSLEGAPHRLLAYYLADEICEYDGILKLQCVENGIWIYAYQDMLEGAFFLLGTDPLIVATNLQSVHRNVFNLHKLPKISWVKFENTGQEFLKRYTDETGWQKQEWGAKPTKPD
ncbi:hypothetical protein L211DRAFT_320083 [Terfezia boudieri ATCC MYA-4762]|uniref:Uncharacterized protein n=1 Tax=Terfezia boudieri ATCC MYA-4762 TaxID=1051890 RepID=A0A3N4LXD9_9PEZI|nr:hypothetical protein L211DRAFT_320083 [Terfezia boudieri ATCC MYA-4762]